MLPKNKKRKRGETRTKEHIDRTIFAYKRCKRQQYERILGLGRLLLHVQSIAEPADGNIVGGGDPKRCQGKFIVTTTNKSERHWGYTIEDHLDIVCM
jgi:hypothetical protein